MRIRDYKSDADALLKRMKETRETSGMSGEDFLVLEVGDKNKASSNIVRFVGDWTYGRVHKLYSLEVPDGVSRKITCLDWLEKRRGECPICLGLQPLWQGSKEEKSIASQQSGKDQYYWCCFPKNSKYDFGDSGYRPLIFNFGFQVAGFVEGIYQSEGDPAHPETGFLVDIQIGKQGGFNRYELKVAKEKVKISGQFFEKNQIVPLTAEEMDMELPDLDNLFRHPSTEDLEYYSELYLGKPNKSDVRRTEVKSDDQGDKPICFGDKEVYDPTEMDCKMCAWFEECGLVISSDVPF